VVVMRTGDIGIGVFTTDYTEDTDQAEKARVGRVILNAPVWGLRKRAAR